jgi:hypothetical protein
MLWMNPKSYSLNRLSIFLHAPAKSGVYLLHNSSRCLYIGDSDNIRQTLLQHLHDHNSAISLFAPDGFSFELQPEASRARRKDQLSSEIEPALERWDEAADEGSLEHLPHGVKFPLARY